MDKGSDVAEDKDMDSTDESKTSAADDPSVDPAADEITAMSVDDADDLDADDLDEDDLDGDGELVPAGVAAGAKPRKGDTEGRSKSSQKKSGAPRKQKRPEDKTSRTTPVQFINESVDELRKVVYPTGSQLRSYFVVVLVFVLFIIAVVSLLDLAFGWAILKVLGR